MVDAAAALPPIAPDDPCGPDLDLAGDSAFMNYLAATEGQMPASFFSFDRKSIDFATAIETGERLLTRSHDLRLITQLAKLNALNRDFAGFARWVATIAELLETHWDEVHPRAEEGDYSQRLAQLGTLDDGPVCVLPLQYAPLLETRRDGAIVYRAQMVVLGEVKPRENETLASAGTIDRILATVELETLQKAYAAADALVSALTRIRDATIAKVGFEQAAQFKALAPLAEKIAEFLRAALAHRDPSQTVGGGETAPPSQALSASEAEAAPSGALESFADIDAALSGALGYFAHREPSSPALLLIAQAREALGKNLYDVMRLLAPSHADVARVFVGPEGAFTVPVSSLASAPSLEFTRAEAQPAPTRIAALALIDAVASHMRRVEPSSPLPYLLERARALASRDFLSLLHEVLPEDNLNSMKEGR
jgi:type VI secretion system protein ImpA